MYIHEALYETQLPSHEELSLMVFDRIMKNPEVLAEFVFIYHLQLCELQLIKDMIHPTRHRRPKEVCLEVHKLMLFICYSCIFIYTGQERKRVSA